MKNRDENGLYPDTIWHGILAFVIVAGLIISLLLLYVPMFWPALVVCAITSLLAVLSEP